MWLQAPTSDNTFKIMIAECNAAKNRLSNRSGFSPLQRVFGMSHRLPADLASDDKYIPDAVYDLAATDSSFEEAVRARARRPVDLRSDDVVMVWKTHTPSRRGKWTGPGVCIGTHKNSVWINMRGSLWKCAREQCKLATSEESPCLGITLSVPSLGDRWVLSPNTSSAERRHER